MWAAIIALAVGFGWALVRWLPFRWYRLEAAAAAVAVGFTLGPWVYFLAAATLGWTAGMVVATGVLAVTWGLSVWVTPRRLQFEPSLRPTPVRVAVWLTAAVVLAWVSYLVVSSYSFPATGAWYSNGNVWGDVPLHVGLATKFAHGNQLDLVSPVYERSALTYPIMADLWSGVLLRVSGNWLIAMMLPTLIMMWALLALAYFAARRLLRSALAAWLSWYMLVLSGPLVGAVRVLVALVRHTSNNAWVITSLGAASNYGYLNFVYSHLLPQRSYLFGMPMLMVAAMIALDLYREREAHGRKRQALRLAGAGGGVLIGLMPLVHTHSFLVMAVLLGVATTVLWWRERRLPVGWLSMIGLAVLLAAPQVLWQVVHSYHGFSHFALGWQGAIGINTSPSWLIFWVSSFGWLMVMLVAGWYGLPRVRARAEVWVVYAVGVVIFVAANVYVFQPSVWDNMKLFEYAAWFAMLATAALLAPACRQRWGQLAVGCLMVSLCTAGFITLVPGARQENYELLSASEVRFGDEMRRMLPVDAYVLVGDRHNSPITMLADRDVLMTYAGWYNLYGEDWEQTMEDRGVMLQGGAGAAELMRHYGVSFAAFSDSEIPGENINLVYFQHNFRRAYHEAGWWVFDLRKRP